MKDVIVVIGAGQIGRLIVRRVGARYVLQADGRPDNSHAAAEVLSDAEYEVGVTTVDAPSREAVRARIQTVARRGELSG